MYSSIRLLCSSICLLRFNINKSTHHWQTFKQSFQNLALCTALVWMVLLALHDLQCDISLTTALWDLRRLVSFTFPLRAN